MNYTVAVIGAGRMGSVIAHKLPQETKKIIIDRDLNVAEKLACLVGGVAENNLAVVEEADLVLVVLPTPVVNETLQELQNYVKRNAVILNMATTAKVDKDIKDKLHIYDAKIIGHAKEISRGEPGIIVVDCANEEHFSIISQQLAAFYRVVQGEGEMVEKINSLASTAGIKTAVTLRKELRALNIDEEWINVAIRTVCAGTMKAFTNNDLGHFAQQLVKKLEQEAQEG